MTKLLGLGLLAAATCTAGILGSSVDVSFDFPDSSTVFVDGGVKTVGPGVEYPAGTFATYNPYMSVDLTDTQLILDSGALATIFTTATFNGLVVTFLTGSISSAVADPSSDFNGVISVSGNQLFINYQANGLVSANALSIVDITGTAPVTGVPEPATWLLPIGGIALLALRRRQLA